MTHMEKKLVILTGKVKKAKIVKNPQDNDYLTLSFKKLSFDVGFWNEIVSFISNISVPYILQCIV